MTAESARAQARRADDALAAGRPLGGLHGLPVAIKDNIDTGGVRTTMGSRFYADNVPNRDAEVVRRLRAAGAVVLGKLSLHEFAYGGTTQNPHFGACRNPWDTTRIPGGSSGGAGAALAADLCAAALGTDTGGSVRSPAALNGVSALRPTLGRISNRGVFPITWSFDTVGPMARSVRDVAALLTVLAGFDHQDPSSREHPVCAYADAVDREVRGLRLGVPTSFYFDGVDPEIASAVRRAAGILEALGCEVVPVTVRGADAADDTTRRIIAAEALAIHRDRLDGHPELFGEDVLRRLSTGAQTTGPEYARLRQAGRDWRRAVRTVFERVDAVLSPTVSFVAPLAARSEMIETTRAATRLTYGWSLAGLPALAVPCGLSSERLPIGLQLAGPPWSETTLLALGAAYQRETEWHQLVAPLASDATPSR